jgi:serine/threonine protein kinase
MVAWSFFKRPPATPVAAAVPGLVSAPPGRPAAVAALLAGRYQLTTRLGHSAAAQVFAAVDLRTGGTVAVKITPLPAELSITERADWLARMQREVNIARRVAHPDIVALLDAGINASQAWIAMERVHGHDLQRYTAASRLLPEPLVLHVGARTAAALAHAHGLGVTHRDLKPANVLVDLAHDTVKLADFGAARTPEHDHDITRTGVTVGTPAYMAPEQLAGAPASAASDVYALGVMLHELLTAQRPHQADTLGELLRAMAGGPAPSLAVRRPDLPPSVVAAVDALLQVDPARRPADLASWAADTAALASVMARVLGQGRGGVPQGHNQGPPVAV